MSSLQLSRLAVLLVLPAILCGQQRVHPTNLYERVVCVVPMVGAGTHDDPRRPLFAPLPSQMSARAGTGIIAFSFLASDDGKTALVELVARDRSAFQGILSVSRADVKVFEKGRGNKLDIEREFGKVKRNFRLEDFKGVAVR